MAQEQQSQRLVLTDRSNLTVTGVTEVISFDEGAVTLQTSMGMLSVQGEELHLKNLSLEGGQVEIDGTISSLAYEDGRQPGGWLSRLLG